MRGEGNIRADIRELDDNFVFDGLKSQPMLFIWWLYDHIVQSRLRSIRSVSNQCLSLTIGQCWP